MAAGFDIIQNEIDLLSGKVHSAVSAHYQHTCDLDGRLAIICDMCRHNDAGFPDVFVVITYA